MLSPLTAASYGRRACRRLVRAGVPSQVGFDQELVAAAEAGPIDLKIFHDPLHVIARLGDRDALDPIDRSDVLVTRIAQRSDPLAHPAAPRIVAGKGEDPGATILV